MDFFDFENWDLMYFNEFEDANGNTIEDDQAENEEFNMDDAGNENKPANDTEEQQGEDVPEDQTDDEEYTMDDEETNEGENQPEEENE